MSTRSTVKYTKRCISDSEITLQTMNTFSIPHSHLIFQLNTPHMLNTISLQFQYPHAYVSAQTPPGYHWHTTCNGPLRTVTGIPLQYTCSQGHPPHEGQWGPWAPQWQEHLPPFFKLLAHPTYLEAPYCAKGWLLSRLPSRTVGKLLSSQRL